MAKSDRISAAAESATAVLDAPPPDAAKDTLRPIPSIPSAVREERPNAATSLQLGDVVLYIDPEQHAGVLNPRVKTAIIAGIHPDGDLCLTVFGRVTQFSLKPKVGYAPKESDQNGTWHRRDE